MGDEAVLTERSHSDKVPKNFLVINLAPASEAAAAKAPSSQPAQRDATASLPPLAKAAAEPSLQRPDAQASIAKLPALPEAHGR